jgi:hypothetical protein
MQEDLLEQASDHGLHPVACDSCAGRGRDDGRDSCPNCLGSGRLWRASGGLTLADAGLRRLLLAWNRGTLASHCSLS